MNRLASLFVFFACMLLGVAVGTMPGIALHAQGTVAAPVFEPDTGVFWPAGGTRSFSVAITCPSEGAEVRYTTNGADPTLSDPGFVSSANPFQVTVNRSLVLKAKAWLGGSESAVTTATYTVNHAVAAGEFSSFALRQTEQLYAWGKNAQGRLGIGNDTDTIIPNPTLVSGNVIDVASGVEDGSAQSHSIFVDSEGYVWCAGSNASGQLGDPLLPASGSSVPVRAKKQDGSWLMNAVAVAAGNGTSFALTADGKVYAWGANGAQKRLGDPAWVTTANRKYADTVKLSDGMPLTGIVAIAAGDDYALALTAGGRVYAWGNDNVGQLGNGSASTAARGFANFVQAGAASNTSPEQDTDSDPLTGITSIAAGAVHALAVRGSDGAVFGWGQGSYGRLGEGTSATTSTPRHRPWRMEKVGPATLTGAVHVSAGNTHSLILMNNGELWACGNDSSGQVGDPTITSIRGRAIQVKKDTAGTPLTNIVDMAAGGAHSIAVDTNGTVYTWGQGGSGQLGNVGSTANVGVATTYPGLPSLKNQPPVIDSLLVTSADGTFVQPVTLQLTASVSDPDGNLAGVEFFDGITLLGPNTTPSTLVLTDLPAGTYTFSATVNDDLGLSATKATNPPETIISLPKVSVAAEVAAVTETGGIPGKFKLTLQKAQLAPVSVGFTISGNAVAEADYVALPSSVVFPAGSTTQVVEVHPRPDYDAESVEALTLTLDSGGGYTPDAIHRSATVSILDSPAPGEIIEIRLPPGRTSSSFDLSSLNTGVFTLLSSGLVENSAPSSSYFSIRVGVDASHGPIDWTNPVTFDFIDQVFGDRYPINAYQAGVQDATTQFGVIYDWQNNEYNFRPVRHFLLPSERRNHQLLVVQDSTFSLVSQYDFTGTVLSTDQSDRVNPSSRFVATAEVGLYNTSPFAMIDLTTGEQSPGNETNLVPVTWSAATTTVPAVWARFVMDRHQAYQRFTLHMRAPGGVVQCQSITADPIISDTETVWLNGTFTSPPNSTVAAGMIGLGMEYWLTRNADGAESPHFFHQNEGLIGFHEAVYNFQGMFAPLSTPVGTTQQISFRIPVGAELWVEHQNGHMAPVTVQSTGWLYSYDDFGNVDNTIEFATATAEVDVTQRWWLVDASGPVGQPHATDILNWNPTHAEPPPIGANSVRVTVPLVGWSNFVLQQEGWSFPFNSEMEYTTIPMSNGYTTIDVPCGVVSAFTYEAIDANGQWLYSVPCVTVDVPYDANKPFKIVANGGPNNAQAEAPANQSNLYNWFPAPRSKQLSISSSRWGHTLYLCQPNGERFLIEEDKTQGNLSFGSNGQAWWNSYYYFGADTLWHDFLDWWIEDATTGETTMRASEAILSGDSLGERLVTWFWLPTPTDLTATSQYNVRAPQLKWNPNGAAEEGAFRIERKVGDAGAWQVYATVSAEGVAEDGMVNFEDSSPVLDSVHYYRVSYVYGGSASTPSGEVQVTVYTDSDGDGLADWWEIEWGFDPIVPDQDGNGAVDSDDDFDGDGTSNGDESQGAGGGSAGSNPGQPPVGPPTPPTAPNTLELKPSLGENKVTLKWRDRSSNESGFVIEGLEYSFPVRRWKVIDSVPPNTEEYVVPKSRVLASSRYRVYAENSAGRSTPTRELFVSSISIAVQGYGSVPDEDGMQATASFKIDGASKNNVNMPLVSLYEDDPDGDDGPLSGGFLMNNFEGSMWVFREMGKTYPFEWTVNVTDFEEGSVDVMVSGGSVSETRVPPWPETPYKNGGTYPYTGEGAITLDHAVIRVYQPSYFNSRAAEVTESAPDGTFYYPLRLNIDKDENPTGEFTDSENEVAGPEDDDLALVEMLFLPNSYSEGTVTLRAPPGIRLFNDEGIPLPFVPDPANSAQRLVSMDLANYSQSPLKALRNTNKDKPAVFYLEGTWTAQAGKLVLEYRKKDKLLTESPDLSAEVFLLPVVLSDIRGESDADDQVISTMKPVPTQNKGESNQAFWQRRNAYFQQQVPDGSIAYIEPHRGANNSPDMPRLVAKLPGGPAGLKVKWKLEVEYLRGNGYRASYVEDFTRPEDKVLIPASEDCAELDADKEWRIFEWKAEGESKSDWQKEIEEYGFFGGTGKLYVWMPGQQSAPTEPIVTFRIGGKNPDPEKAKTFINAEAGSQFWYAYAIAKHETAGRVRENGQNRYYNQFYTDHKGGPIGDASVDMGWAAWAKSWPLYNLDRGRRKSGTRYQNGPGGYGLFQLTLGPKEPDAKIPQGGEGFIKRKEIWNWQDNARGAIKELQGKVAKAESLRNALHATYSSSGAIPSYGPFSGLEALTITFYNGMDGGELKPIAVNGYKKPQLTCWYPRGGGWTFLQNRNRYCEKVKAKLD